MKILDGCWILETHAAAERKLFTLSFEYLHIYKPKVEIFRRKTSKIASIAFSNDTFTENIEQQAVPSGK